ncbi:MAG: hypothetical protein QM811_30495 [Pirellulales bacterium]
MQDLPRWNLQNIFPGLDDAAYLDARALYENDLTALEALFDRYDVRRIDSAAALTTDDVVVILENIFVALDESSKAGETLGSYLHGLITTDSYDAQARAKTRGWRCSAHDAGNSTCD